MRHPHEETEDAIAASGDHAHTGDHDRDHEHDHEHGRLGWLREAIPFPHGHSHGETNVDAALEGSERGLWALKVSLAGLGLTAAFQLVIVLISGRGRDASARGWSGAVAHRGTSSRKR